MRQLNRILDMLGYILGALAFISPSIRKDRKQAKAIQSSILMAQGLIEDLQTAQSASSEGGATVTFAEFEAISHKAVRGIQDIVAAMEDPQ